MTRTLMLSLAGAVAATILAFGVAQASPATGALDSLRSASQSTVEQTHYRCHRHCWWHRGHRHCRRVCHW